MLRALSAAAFLVGAVAPPMAAPGADKPDAWWLPPPTAYAAGGFANAYPATAAATGAAAHGGFAYAQNPAVLAAYAQSMYGANTGYAPYSGYYNQAAYYNQVPYYNRAAAGYPYAGAYPTAASAAMPGVPGGISNVYSMYPSTYYRFQGQQQEEGDGGAAATPQQQQLQPGGQLPLQMPRFAERGAEMAGADEGAETDAGATAAAHGYEARHWSDFAAPASQQQQGGEAEAPLPGIGGGGVPASAYRPAQRIARIKAMQGELEQRIGALRAIRERRRAGESDEETMRKANAAAAAVAEAVRSPGEDAAGTPE